MKRIFIILLFSFLFTLFLGSHIKVTANSNEKFERFFIPKITIRVDKDYVIPAAQIFVTGHVINGKFDKIVLRFATDRASLLKLIPPHFDLNIDPVKILTLRADKPVYVEAIAKDNLLKRANREYTKGVPFSKLMTIVDENHFPMMLDLENYRARGYLQEVSRTIR